MERPENTNSEWKGDMERYIENIDKYCDWLEVQLFEIEKSLDKNHRTFKRNMKELKIILLLFFFISLFFMLFSMYKDLLILIN